MVKGLVFFIAFGLFIGCASSKKVTDTALSPVNTIFKDCYFTATYPISCSSETEDIVLVSKHDLATLSSLFNDGVARLANENGYNLVNDSTTSLQLIITQFDVKEFILYVDGPAVNVMSLKIEYKIKTSDLVKVLVEEINIESLKPFEKSILNEMCSKAAENMMNKLNAEVN